MVVVVVVIMEVVVVVVVFLVGVRVGVVIAAVVMVMAMAMVAVVVCMAALSGGFFQRTQKINAKRHVDSHALVLLFIAVDCDLDLRANPKIRPCEGDEMR